MRRNPGSQSPVILNVYTLSYYKKINRFTSTLGLGGAFHTGVEVYGIEFAYACNRGVHALEPRTFPGCIYKKSFYMGDTTIEWEDIASVIRDMREQFRGTDYNLLTHNCHSFCEAFCRQLVNRRIPKRLKKLPRIIAHFRHIIPRIKVQPELKIIEPRSVTRCIDGDAYSSYSEDSSTDGDYVVEYVYL
mmetsp:Transcript_27446/g.30565  ORF Transcript_27446/g.30565 Transcript_27446/m.30565 type:complete len:189 (+) Transcript_27446:45-611(+)